MLAALTIILGFMVFLLILNKGRIIFWSFFSLLMALALSLGVGYGMAVFILEIMGPLCRFLSVILSIIALIAIINKKERDGNE